MRRLLTVASVLVTLLAGASVTLADEVVHFTNGTSMVIESHRIQDGMIEVHLGKGAVMAFPSVMVERIEKAGRDVYNRDTYSPSNQAIEASEGQTAVPPDAVLSQPGLASMPARFRGRRSERPDVSAEERQTGFTTGYSGSAPADVQSTPLAPRRRAVDIQLKADRGQFLNEAGRLRPNGSGLPSAIPNESKRTPRFDMRDAELGPRSVGVGQPAPPAPEGGSKGGTDAQAPEASTGGDGSEG